MEIDMEKRLRDCTRHMENLDYTALSQEDIKKETEDILVELHSFDDLLAMIRHGKITDSLTIMALLMISADRNKYGL